MKKKQCIAMIDSGIGGLSLLKLCHKSIDCDFVFVMDNEFCPYGEKTPSKIIQRIKSICEFLIEYHHVDIVVLACNTATSITIEKLRKAFSVPIVGMEPPIKPAVDAGKKNIIVMSTPITNKYSKLVKKYKSKSGVKLISFSNLAKEIENNFFELNKLEREVEKKFTQDDKKNCDAIVLGCSHFQYIENNIKKFFEKDVQFFHSEAGVEKRIKSIIGQKENKEGRGRIEIIQTSFDKHLLKLANLILFS